MTTREKIGAVLVAISCLLWLGVPLLPFLPLSTRAMAWGGAAIVAGAEGAFWLGVLVAGRDVMRRYRSVLNPRRWLAALTGSAAGHGERVEEPPTEPQPEEAQSAPPSSGRRAPMQARTRASTSSGLPSPSSRST